MPSWARSHWHLCRDLLDHDHHVHCFYHVPRGQRSYLDPCRVESLDSLFVGSLGYSFLARPSGQASRIVSRMCWRSSLSVLVLILTLVSTGRGRRIRLASIIPFYLLSSIYSSFAKLWCKKRGNFMGEEKIRSLYLQRKDTSSHGPYVYRTVPYMEIMACI